ncbi:cystathionine gamma-synthase 1, chloroplastic-like [Bidens hawaiensis]|uniref:cystathionine gamma-synthase 1, chloroplastic-like n=1 Tax=Bidens hawaiensis TaxID=980011 RepID=UPI00404AC0B7
MAMSSCTPRVSFPFECRSDSSISGAIPRPDDARFSAKLRSSTGKQTFGMSSLILRFPPNFVRQLSNKARRNCSNIGVAQIVAASWSNNQPPFTAAAAVDAAVSVPIAAGEDVVVDNNNNNIIIIINDDDKDLGNDSKFVQFEASFLNGDGSVAIHAGERLGRGIVTDAITTPVVNTSATTPVLFKTNANAKTRNTPIFGGAWIYKLYKAYGAEREGALNPSPIALDHNFCISMQMVQQIDINPPKWRFRDALNQVWDPEDPADMSIQDIPRRRTGSPPRHTRLRTYSQQGGTSSSGAGPSSSYHSQYSFEGLYRLIDQFQTHNTASFDRLLGKIVASYV